MNKNFTLTELLVVVAIIGILVTLLLPSLSKAKDAAKSAVCRSNLKQTSIALAAFMKESKARFPGHNSGVSNWHGNSGTYNSGWKTSFDLSSAGRPLNKYIGKFTSTNITELKDLKDYVQLARCPGDNSTGPAYTFEKVGSSYISNSKKGRHLAESDDFGRFLSEVSEPSKVVSMSEAQGFLLKKGSAPNEHYSFHLKGLERVNTLFVDGAAKRIRMVGGYTGTSEYTWQRD